MFIQLGISERYLPEYRFSRRSTSYLSDGIFLRKVAKTFSAPPWRREPIRISIFFFCMVLFVSYSFFFQIYTMDEFSDDILVDFRIFIIDFKKNISFFAENIDVDFFDVVRDF